jgi:integrase
VFGRVLPVDAELERFIAERVTTVRYAGRHRRAVSRLKGWMLAKLGTDDLRRLTRRHAGEFVDHLLGTGVSTATANSLVSSLTVYWLWLDRRIGVERSPWPGQGRRARPEEPIANKRPFTDDEVARLLNGETYGTLHDLMRVAALSGMRLDEIARLTVTATEGGILRITEGKTASSVREVPVHPDLTALINRRRGGKAGHDRLFHELRAPPSRNKEISAKASERFTEYRRKIGIDQRVEGQRQSDVDFHSFRRWFITKAEMAGQAPHLISAVVGHAEGRKGMTLGTYSGGPSLEQRLAVVSAVRLPKAAAIEKLDGPLMGATRRGGQKGAPGASPEGTPGPRKPPLKVKS